MPERVFKLDFLATVSILLLSGVLAFSVPTHAGHPGSQGLALVGGTVITANAEPPIPDAVVLIENGRITAVGSRRSVAVPPDFQVIDAHGKFITPGLIDTNAHLVLMTVPEFFVKYEDLSLIHI